MAVALTRAVTGTLVSSTTHNNNMTAIENEVNGGIDATNLDSTIFTGAAYTPTWTGAGGNPSIGNGSISGRYIAIGKYTLAYVKITMGSTTTFGAGEWSVSLPRTAASSSVLWTGTGKINDASGAAHYLALPIIATTTTVTLFSAADTTSTFTSASPFTWATSDSLLFSIAYEAA